MYEDLLLKAGIDLTQLKQDKKDLLVQITGINGEFLKGSETVEQAISRNIISQKGMIEELGDTIKKIYAEADKMSPGQGQANILGKVEDLEKSKQILQDELAIMEQLKTASKNAGDGIQNMNTNLDSTADKVKEASTKFTGMEKDMLLSITGMNGELLKGTETIAQAIQKNIVSQKQLILEAETELKKVYDSASKKAAGQEQANLIGKGGQTDQIEERIRLMKEELATMDRLKVGMDGTGSAVTRLRAQYMNARNTLAEYNAMLKEGQNVPIEKYRQAEAEVARLGQTMGETNRQASRLSAGGLAGVIGNLGTLAGGLAVGQSLMGSFGSKNEDINKVMLKAQALLSASVTLNQIRTTQMERGGVVAGIVAFQEGLRVKAINMGTVATGRATVAQRLYNFVAMQNPYVLLALGIGTVMYAVYKLSSANKDAIATQRELNKAVEDGMSQTANEIVSLETLYKTATNDKLSREQRLKAVDDLRKKYPGLFANINQEIIMNGKAAQSYYAVRDAIIASARAKAAGAVLEKRVSDQLLEREKQTLKVAENMANIKKLESEKAKGNKTMKVDYKDAKGGYSGTVNIDEAIKRQKDAIKGILTNVTEGARDFEVRNTVLTKAIEKGTQKMFEATTEPPAEKGTRRWYEQEIERLDKSAIGLQSTGKKYKEIMGEIEKYKDIIKAKEEKVPKVKKAKKEKKAEEYLPIGSVAEIQKRVSAIDKLLSKETDTKKIELYKSERIKIATELAKAEKKIRIQSLQDQSSDMESYFNAYRIIAEKNGKKLAEEMYRPLIGGSQSYYDWLQKEKSALIERQSLGFLSEKEQEDIAFFTNKLAEISGSKTAFESFTNDISASLDKLPLMSDKIRLINEERNKLFEAKGSQSYDSGEQRFLAEQEESVRQQQKEKYERLLADQKTFQEQSLELEKEFAEMKSSQQYVDGSKADQTKIDKYFAEKSSKLQLEIFKDSQDWQMAFADMEFVSQEALKRIEENLIRFKEVQGKTLEPSEMRELENALRRIRDSQANNPFTEVVKSYKNLKDAKDEVYFANERYNASLKNSGANSENAKKASEELAKADRKLAEAKQDLFNKIKKGQDVFNAVGQGVMDLGDMLGGFDDATKDAVESIMDIGNAAMDLGTSIASGDVAGMIKAGVALIGSVWKAINGDKKKEREIKKQATALKALEMAYNDLATASQKAFGSSKYSSQRDMIRNLEEQKNAINNMLRSESEKKKKDQGKIDGYNAQMQQINQSIQDLKDGIIKDVLQTDIPDMASKLGDALVDAFGRGEDSAKALEQTANDMIKNILKNQLKLKLQDSMGAILKDLMTASGFNEDGTGSFQGLTPQQIADFKAQIIAAGQNMQGFLDGYSDIFGDIGDNAQGIKGDIKGITEKTAGALEGRINGMAVTQSIALQIAKDSLIELSAIEMNTRNLIQMRIDISEMNGKMKKSMAGLP